MKKTRMISLITDHMNMLDEYPYYINNSGFQCTTPLRRSNTEIIVIFCFYNHASKFCNRTDCPYEIFNYTICVFLSCRAPDGADTSAVRSQMCDAGMVVIGGDAPLERHLSRAIGFKCTNRNNLPECHAYIIVIVNN